MTVWLTRLLLVAASLAAPLLLGELAARLAGYRGLEQYQPEPELGWRLVPDQRTVTSVGRLAVAINADGLRDDPLATPKPARTIRIVALGASTTYGWGVRLEDTYHQLLERQLNQAAGAAGDSTRYEIVNAGVIGYNLWQVAALLDRMMGRHALDGALVAYTFNDAWNRYGTLTAAEQARVLAGVRRKNLLRRSALFNWLTATIGRRAYDAAAFNARGDGAAMAQTGDGAASEAELGGYRDTVERLMSRAAEAGVSLAVMLPAARGQLDPWPRQVALARAATAHGVPLVDLLPVFRSLAAESVYLPHDAVHPSVVGHRIIARELHAALCAAAAGEGTSPAAIYRAGCGLTGSR